MLHSKQLAHTTQLEAQIVESRVKKLQMEEEKMLRKINETR